MVNNQERVHVGVWSELPPGARWANEGISRIVGFLIEGGAVSGRYLFHVLVPRGMAETVRADLRTLIATEGSDWLVSEPTQEFETGWLRSNDSKDMSPKERAAALLADYANKHIKVEGWINTFPHFEGSRLLKARKAVLLPDAIPFDFPIGWDYGHYWSEQGEWVRWRDIAAKTLQDGEAVIAHSEHVAQRHGVKLLGLDERNISVVPHAPPDLAPILPFIKDRMKTPETRRLAAGILRAYAAEKGLEYLRSFPFEEVPFVFLATQDRVTKNVGRAAEVVRRLIVHERANLKLFTTAPVHHGANWTLFPSVHDNHILSRDIISVPDIPRDVHAAFFHCAEATIHPTFYEGIVGTLTFYESVSVGTPCLIAEGPHVRELLETEPQLDKLKFNPYDMAGLADLLMRVLSAPQAAWQSQLLGYENRRKRGWDVVADAYAYAATGR